MSRNTLASGLVLGTTLLLSSGIASAQTPPQQPDDLAKLKKELTDSKAEVSEIRNLLIDTQEKVVKLDGLLKQRQFFGASHGVGSSVPASDFLPPPADPRNLFFNEMNAADTNLGAGTRVLGTSFIFRAAGTGSALFKYDTGLLPSVEFDPALIAIGGQRAQGAGNFGLAGFTGGLKIDLNAALSEAEQAQAYVDTDYVDDELRIRQAFGRIQLSTINVLAGSYWTAWGDEGTIPKSISLIGGFPAGSQPIDGVPQLRFGIPFGDGWVTTLALQQPLTGDFDLRDTDVVLHRYPDIAARLRYYDGDFFSASLGGYFRIFGRENTPRDEQFERGWGVATTTRFRLTEQGAFMLGGVFGEGIAGTIYGLSTSLSSETSLSGDLTALRNYGGYVGYQHQMKENLLATLAYGIAQSEGHTTNFEPTRSAQNAWANVIYLMNENFAFGVQYDYGVRDLANGASGENHRFSFIVSVAIGVKDKASAESMLRALPSSQADAIRSEVQQAVPQERGASRFRRM